jgi:hypothetical protein
MKRMFIVLIGFALFSGSATLAKAHEQCSNATLNGSFGVYASGSVIGVGPVALLGVLTYDGNGNLTGTVFQKVNGNNVQVTLTGTYSVDSNCLVSDTSLASTGQVATHEYVIVDDGKEFYILNTTPPTATSGNVIVGVGKKQFPKEKHGKD